MAINHKQLIIGAALSFCKDGTAITNEGGAEVCSRTVKPDGTTPGDWLPFSTIEKCDVKGDESKEEVMTPSPGAYRRSNVLRTSMKLDLSVTTQDLSEVILQSVLQSGTIAGASGEGGNAFSPFTTLGEIRGWWKLKKYSQDDVLILDAEFYGIGVCRALTAENKMVKPQFDIAVLWNSLNSGISTLANAAG